MKTLETNFIDIKLASDRKSTFGIPVTNKGRIVDDEDDDFETPLDDLGSFEDLDAIDDVDDDDY